MKLDGFGIFVKDMKTMVCFYRDVLGFEIKEDENASNVIWKRMAHCFYCTAEAILKRSQTALMNIQITSTVTMKLH